MWVCVKGEELGAQSVENKFSGLSLVYSPSLLTGLAEVKEQYRIIKPASRKSQATNTTCGDL